MRQLRQRALDDNGVLRVPALLVLVFAFVGSSLGFATLGGWFGLTGIAAVQVMTVSSMIVADDRAARRVERQRAVQSSNA